MNPPACDTMTGPTAKFTIRYRESNAQTGLGSPRAVSPGRRDRTGRNTSVHVSTPADYAFSEPLFNIRLQLELTRPFPCMPFATSSVDCNHLVEAAERVGSLVAEAMAGHAALR